MLRPFLRSNARWVFPFSDQYLPLSGLTRKRTGSGYSVEKANLAQAGETRFRLLPEAVKECPNSSPNGADFFGEMKQRFLSFKKNVYLEELEHYHKLAEVQAPKCMVIACADSRVCPSNILGIQPGEAFTIRNVANFVPPLDNGPSETNAALEFAVNTLKVENILVIGHSRCGGIEALMNMQDEVNTSFVHNWIIKAKDAKFRARVAAPCHSFDQQCRHCEKESINGSLLNLLTYPWIYERVEKNQLSIHGGYYDLMNCTFEKWTLGIKTTDTVGGRYFLKDQTFWS